MGTAKTRGPTRPSSNGNDPAAGEFGVGKVLDSEKLTTLLFDSITDFITVQDTDFNILKINKVVGEVYGTDVVGRKCYEAYQGRRSVCPGCAVENALATGEPAFSSEQKGKPGNYAEIWAFPIRDEQGNIVAVAEHGRDISERKKTEVELAELNGKLEKTNRKLEVANKRLKQLVVVDSHTGLFNHRYLEGALKTKFQKARKKKNRLSLIMFDLDYFKSINDVYGHPFGDVVLTQVSELLKNGVRKHDTLARFGGEEFALLVPEANRTNAESLAKGLLESVARERFGTAEHGVHIKMSAGVVSYPEDAAVDGSELLSKADKALRAAKERGGNCVSGPSDSVPEESGGNDSGDPAHVRRLKQRIGNLSKRSNQYMTEAMFAFVKTLELKDPYAGDHADQTVTYAVETAKILGLTAPEIESIRKAAMLRDLGKVSLSDSILKKRGPLSSAEFEEAKMHPQRTVDIIRPVQSLNDLVPLVLFHHERWDGNGYPRGLEKKGIPIGAQIVGVADVFQALSSARPYREAYSREQVVELITSGSGTQFDPQVAAAFLTVLKQDQSDAEDSSVPKESTP